MKLRPELQKLVDDSVARFNALTPGQQEAHRDAQRKSWVRAEMSWPKAKFKWVNGAKVYDSYDDYVND